VGFSGWRTEAVKFFQGLRADNTKAYWNANQAVYEASVREPMAALLDELSGEFGPGRIARPYRDVRFHADKSPYKTEIYAILEDHPRIELLRWKGLICWRDWPVAPWLHTAKARDHVAGFLRTAAPLQRWLDLRVGRDPA
jgi:hypothetical protein